MASQLPPAELISAHRSSFKDDPQFVVRAPGRADLIGTHVDYNDGLVLPAAITRNAWVAVSPARDPLITIRSLDMQETVQVDLNRLASKQTAAGDPLPGWTMYAAGVAWALHEYGFDLPPLALTVTGDVPVGAGLSSSAAVEVAYAMAWAHALGWDSDPGFDRMTLARLCQRAENGYVGVNSGLMDQFSSAFGQADHALLLDCRTYEWEAVPLSDRVALVIADTTTRRTLATSKYNERRAECEQAVEALRAIVPEIRALRDVPVEVFHQHKHLIPQPARDRAQHVVEEIARVQSAAGALRRGDVGALGERMDESHISSRDLYAASGPELDAMWEASRGHPARLGGRFLGAGWAGCLIFLVDADGAGDFAAFTGLLYEERTGRAPSFYTVQAAQGAEILPMM